MHLSTIFAKKNITRPPDLLASPWRSRSNPSCDNIRGVGVPTLEGVVMCVNSVRVFHISTSGHIRHCGNVVAESHVVKP